MLESLNNWLTDLPTSWANTITMLLFGLLLIILWSFPRRFVLRGAPDQSRWRDIRIWATVLVFVQLGIYTVFR